MNRLKNEKGIALVTALMLTLISLTFVMAALYLLTQGIRTSASTKQYKSALEASYGGVEFFTKDALPEMLQAGAGFTSASFLGLYAAHPTLNMTIANTSDACMQLKLTSTSASWVGVCTANEINSDIAQLKTTADLVFNLPGTAGSPGYRVFTKVVETKVGNTDTSVVGSSGALLVGSGVGRSVSQAKGGGSGPATKIPYLFTLEVQGEAATNPLEKKELTVLYAH
jgi:hypothetical protein